MRASAAGAPDAWSIEPARAGAVEMVRELWRYRRLLWFFAIEGIQGMYAGTSLGIFWLFARPLFPILIGSFVFGSLLEVPSDGVPYFLFFLSGMSVWMLFDRSLLWVTRSMDQQRNLLKKLYFPRLLVPISAVSRALVYFFIYMALIIGTAIYIFVNTGRWYLAVGPGWLVAIGASLMAILSALAIGLYTCVLQTKYKDVRFGLRYSMGFWMYLTPVIYPISQVPPNLRWVIYLNPMASVVETFKWSLLGVGQLPVVPLLSAMLVVTIVGAGGVRYFLNSEAASVDDM
ncbi:MAG: ABC transporter permease [Acidobacteria bacterium]|nr:ABC transporter permease [Acidobacteriota bacterium]